MHSVNNCRVCPDCKNSTSRRPLIADIDGLARRRNTRLGENGIDNRRNDGYPGPQKTGNQKLKYRWSLQSSKINCFQPFTQRCNSQIRVFDLPPSERFVGCHQSIHVGKRPANVEGGFLKNVLRKIRKPSSLLSVPLSISRQKRFSVSLQRLRLITDPGLSTDFKNVEETAEILE